MSATSRELLLLSDHLKLSLLERQRAVALKIDHQKEDAQIERSLAQLQQGLETLDSQEQDLGRPEDSNSDLAKLHKQYSDLYAQYHGTAAPTRATSQPNDPSLRSDFAAAQSRPARSKNVRFRDNPDDEQADANRAALFADQERYTDEPSAPDQTQLDNQQIHQYHKQVIRDQDEQLDMLGASLGRQRVLGIQMGNELDEQNEMIEDLESGVDRHQSLLDRASKRLTHVARKSKANWSWITITILICILLILIFAIR